MNSKDKCLDLSVIPQFNNSCWFNAILMITLYSQGVREIVLKEARNWNKSNQFLMIIKAILVKYYNQPEKTQEFFNKINPDLILLKMISNYKYNFTLKKFKTNFKKNISNLNWIPDFIILLFSYLNIKFVDFSIIDNKFNKFLLNFSKFIIFPLITIFPNIYYFNFNITSFYRNFISITKFISLFKNSSTVINNKNDIAITPDILLVINTENLKNCYYNINKILKSFSTNIFNIYNKQKLNVIGLQTYEDIIEYNGNKYKLDSCLLNNYNHNFGNHVIAGITCNNNRYVYNGWMKQSDNNLNKSPCSLMKYHWDLKKNENFCLNPKTCKLDFLKDMEKKDLCFSFAKGQKILVYTIINENKEKSFDLSIPNSLNFEDISDVIKDISNIKNLTDKKLKIKLGKLLGYSENKSLFIFIKKTRAELETLYLKELKKYYNYNHKKIKLSP